jgi:hypothetical protein
MKARLGTVGFRRRVAAGVVLSAMLVAGFLPAQGEPATPAAPAPASQGVSPQSGPESRPATDTRRTSPDVPPASKDPVVDGMKSIVREMVQKGFAEDATPALAERIEAILEIGGVGDEGGRARESLAAATMLISIQRDYRPRGDVVPQQTLSPQDEARVNTLGEGLARDLYRRLPRAATSRPTSPDVPAWSSDPMLDGMKSIVRELILKGFAKEDKDALTGRIRLVLEIADVGDGPSRLREAESLALTLLEIQRDYRPSGNLDPKRTLTNDDEQRIRYMAEALSRDLYRRLPKAGQFNSAGGHNGGQHTGAFRAAAPLKPPPGYEVVEWKTLGGFEYKEGMELPENVRALHGKKVALAGYMFTLDEIENIKHFLIVESLWSCCFGVPPNVNQVIEINIAGRRGVEYTSLPVMLTGTLEVGEKMEDGFVVSLYRLKLEGPQGVKPVE